MDLRDIYTGSAITLDGAQFIVLKQQHVKMGRGGAVVQAKLRNVATGAVIDRTIRPGDNFAEADVERTSATFLYTDQDAAHFMDATSFEQFSLPLSTLSKQTPYLTDGIEVTVLFVEEQPISVELPKKVDLEVTDTPPNVKGNTAQGGTKPATLSTGLVVNVPLFINVGDTIRVNTDDNSYVLRVNS